MATETKPIAFNFDEEKIKAKLAIIEKNVNEQQGKKLHNPFLWLHKVVNPLIKRLQGYKTTLTQEQIDKGEEVKEFPPEKSEALFNAIMALPEVPPIPKIAVDANPTETNIRADRPQSLGLNLPTKNF